MPRMNTATASPAYGPNTTRRRRMTSRSGRPQSSNQSRRKPHANIWSGISMTPAANMYRCGPPSTGSYATASNKPNPRKSRRSENPWQYITIHVTRMSINFRAMSRNTAASWKKAAIGDSILTTGCSTASSSASPCGCCCATTTTMRSGAFSPGTGATP